MTDTRNFDDMDNQRKWQFVNRVFAGLVVYCAIIIALLILNGFHFLGFALTPTVLLLLVSSLVATAFFLMVAAARVLFGPLKPKD